MKYQNTCTCNVIVSNILYGNFFILLVCSSKKLQADFRDFRLKREKEEELKRLVGKVVLFESFSAAYPLQWKRKQVNEATGLSSRPWGTLILTSFWLSLWLSPWLLPYFWFTFSFLLFRSLPCLCVQQACLLAVTLPPAAWRWQKRPSAPAT